MSSIDSIRLTVHSILLIVLLNPDSLLAQELEVGAFYSVSQTGISELGHPSGPAISVTWPIRQFAGFRLEASRLTSSPNWTATTCDEYWPLNTNCREERVENDFRSRHFAASLVAQLRRGAWRVEGVLGLSRIDLEHDIAGIETGRLLDRSDGESELGASWGGAFVREGIGADRLSARLEWGHFAVDSRSCATDSYCPPWWNGFDINEFRAGASWRF
jgi:hypothetical protein